MRLETVRVNHSVNRTQKELIGLRLRVFREDVCKMSRTAFALSIGIGSERLASYESGRAPLRYDIFRRIALEHMLNPAWLATETLPVRFNHSLEYNEFDAKIPPRALFVDAYDRWLRKWIEEQQTAAGIAFRTLLQGIDELDALPEEAKRDLPADYNEQIKRRLEELLQKMKAHLKNTAEGHAEVELHLARERDTHKPTPTTSRDTIVDKKPGAVYTSSTDMKTRWKDYQKKLKQLCAVRGTKAAIAKKLKVSRTMVSKWVEGSEPSYDLAIQIIEWIDKNWKATPET